MSSLEDRHKVVSSSSSVVGMETSSLLSGDGSSSLLLLSSSSSSSPHVGVAPGGGVPHKRKNTSFKITNILPSRPPSHDPEESGEEDPDDSHTEDLSDAPEDLPDKKLSSSVRRNSFDAAASAAAACVAAGGTKEAAVSILSSNGLPASAMSVLNDALPVFSKNAKWVSSILSVALSAQANSDARQGPRDRFKVVRMETTVPLKRGRWTCIDYIDKRITSHAAAAAAAVLNAEKNELMDNNGVVEGEEDPLLRLPPLATIASSSSVVPSTHHHHIVSSSTSSSMVRGEGGESVRLSSNSQTPSVAQSPSGPPSYSTSSSQQMIQQIYQKGGPTNPTQVIQFTNTPAVVTCQSMIKQQQQSPLLIPQNSTNLVSSSSGSGLPPPPSQQQQQHIQPVPSPQMSTTHHIHHHHHHHTQPQQQQQLILEGGPLSSYITPISFAGLLPTSSAVSSIPPSRAETDILPAAAAFYPAHFDHPIDNEHLVERLEEISTQQNAPSVEEDVDNSCDVINNNNHSSSSSTGGARAANHFIVEGHQSTPTPGGGGGGGNVFASYNGGCSSNGHLPYHQHLHHHQQRLHRYHSRPGSSGPGISRLTSRGVSPSKERPSSSHEGAHLLASFVSSASGTNQGAIDNRIEQAMDLVKSHLMNAVRSEVEELKERIVKLEDVISHLQNENDFLKANVSQEVLTQLPPPSTTHHQILQQPPGSNPTQGGGLSPTISSPLVVSSQQQQQQQQPM